MSDTPRSGPADAAARLSQDTADLIRAELQRSRTELLSAARRGGGAAALLGGAGVCGVLALATGTVTVLRVLEAVTGPKRAALLLTLAYGGGAAALAFTGVRAAQAAAASAQQAVDATGDDVRRWSPSD